jgi:protein-L-isoaspartate(D-aspartate) O-methyltransferase
MDFEAARARLMAQLNAEIKDKRVLAAMARIPRELFVPPESRRSSYEDRPLPIGWEQTISQPFIIALMTEALELTGDEKVLEVGTGSGYQTAILAELCQQVVTVERLPALAETARHVLNTMVIPVGSRYAQELYKVTKREDENSIQNLGGCRFVPLIGRTAWEE